MVAEFTEGEAASLNPHPHQPALRGPAAPASLRIKTESLLWCSKPIRTGPNCLANLISSAYFFLSLSTNHPLELALLCPLPGMLFSRASTWLALHLSWSCSLTAKSKIAQPAGYSPPLTLPCFLSQHNHKVTCLLIIGSWSVSFPAPTSKCKLCKGRGFSPLSTSEFPEADLQ